MAMPFLNYTDSSLNFEKSKNNPKNSNLKSSWAFLFSILIYISVFYVFNLSPSTLLCTTKFWFIISNTLILIIAADFGAFSSTKNYDFYDEYRRNNMRAKNTLPSFDIPHARLIDEKTMPKYREKDVEIDEPREKIIGMVVPSKNQDPLENKSHEIFVTNEKLPNDGKIVKRKREIENGAREVIKKKEGKCVIRSKSEKANGFTENKEKMVLRKTMSERYDDYDEETRLEENEFTRMSDEELNRRVEDFIRRFNRQIRLQAAAGN